MHLFRKLMGVGTGLLLGTAVLAAPAPMSKWTSAVAQDLPPPAEGEINPDTPVEAEEFVRDGSSPERAAASCWAIKQEDSDSQNGVYWLLSPGMSAPAEFFCDQTMDGGGWVKIGKGREGWDRYPDSKGDISQLLSGTRTPADFETAQMPEKMIKELMGGEKVNQTADGFRIVRAMDSAGTQWQRADVKPQRMADFSWALASEDMGRWRIDNGPWEGPKEMNQNFGGTNSYHTIDMSISPVRQYKIGFGFGYWTAGGSSDPNNFLWTPIDMSPLPYAEVYLRPQIANDDSRFARIADEGTAAKEQRAVVSSFAAPSTWGVTGNLTGLMWEGNAPVQAFVEQGDVMFVGGNFTHVEQRSTGIKVPRTAVAAFDKNTGDFIESFDLKLDSKVKSLLAMPDNKLLVGGEFTEANGLKRTGLVLVDSVTGEVDENFDVNIVNKLSGGVVSVRALEASDDHIYVGGSFTHLKTSASREVYARGAGRMAFDGHPDITWNPEFNGTVNGLDVSEDGQRLYAAGHFTRTKQHRTEQGAVISTEAGAQTADPNFKYIGSSVAGHDNFQFDVQETANNLFFAGAQHSVSLYNMDNLRFKTGSISKENGGDFQSLAADGDVVYAGCHCDDNVYQGAYTWTLMNRDWTEADKIQWLGAWDANTGEQLDEFAPYMLESNNAGAWALEVDDNGTLWTGGDFTGSRTDLNTRQWNGGFVRYNLRDHVAPTTPEGFDAELNEDGTAATVRWDPSTDDISSTDGITYEVLLNDRVVATTADTEVTVDLTADTARLFVRAADQAGNRSASTSVIDLKAEQNPEEPENPEGPAEPTTLISLGEEWNYSYAQGRPDDNWNTNEADYRMWDTGIAPIGYGAPELQTTIDRPQVAADRPVTTWFAKRFEVGNPDNLRDVTLNFIADDGAIVYVNGEEVARVRLDEGDIDENYRANAVFNTDTAEQPFETVTIPAELLNAGTNTIAAETHLNYLSSRSMSFEAELTAGEVQGPIADPEPQPEDPAPELEPVNLLDEGTVWRYRFDQVAPEADWNQPDGLDVFEWEQGYGLIGWGDRFVDTVIDVPASQRPLATYFVRDLDINKAEIDEAYGVVRFVIRADDGAVVYLNGREIGRQGMGDGEVTHGTYASRAINSVDAGIDPLVIEIPFDEFADGTNRIAVQTHLNYRSTPTMTFKAQATLLPVLPEGIE